MHHELSSPRTSSPRAALAAAIGLAAATAVLLGSGGVAAPAFAAPGGGHDGMVNTKYLSSLQTAHTRMKAASRFFTRLKMGSSENVSANNLRSVQSGFFRNVFVGQKGAGPSFVATEAGDLAADRSSLVAVHPRKAVAFDAADVPAHVLTMVREMTPGDEVREVGGDGSVFVSDYAGVDGNGVRLVQVRARNKAGGAFGPAVTVPVFPADLDAGTLATGIMRAAEHAEVFDAQQRRYTATLETKNPATGAKRSIDVVLEADAGGAIVDAWPRYTPGTIGDAIPSSNLDLLGSWSNGWGPIRSERDLRTRAQSNAVVRVFAGSDGLPRVLDAGTQVGPTFAGNKRAKEVFFADTDRMPSHAQLAGKHYLMRKERVWPNGVVGWTASTRTPTGWEQAPDLALTFPTNWSVRDVLEAALLTRAKPQHVLDVPGSDLRILIRKVDGVRVAVSVESGLIEMVAPVHPDAAPGAGVGAGVVAGAGVAAGASAGAGTAAAPGAGG